MLTSLGIFLVCVAAGFGLSRLTRTTRTVAAVTLAKFEAMAHDCAKHLGAMIAIDDDGLLPPDVCDRFWQEAFRRYAMRPALFTAEVRRAMEGAVLTSYASSVALFRVARSAPSARAAW